MGGQYVAQPCSDYRHLQFHPFESTPTKGRELVPGMVYSVYEEYDTLLCCLSFYYALLIIVKPIPQVQCRVLCGIGLYYIIIVVCHICTVGLGSVMVLLSDPAYLLIHIHAGSAESDGLTTITNCICPGYNVVYQCVVTEGIFTVWGGNAFQCAGDSITLRNSDFGSLSSPAVGECNSRQILARGISQDNSCYISQLNVTLTEELLGRTVTCGFNDGTLNLVNSTVITASTSKQVSYFYLLPIFQGF